MEVELVDGINSEQLFEGRTITLKCVNSTINQTSTDWYRNDRIINTTTTRNLTLTLKRSDTGLYKCKINGTISTKGLSVTVKGMNIVVF